MYYFSTTKQTKAALDFTKEGKQIDEKNLIKILEKEGYCYLANLNLLILRNESYIQQVFGNATFDEIYFRYLIETQKEAYFRASVSVSPVRGRACPAYTAGCPKGGGGCQPKSINKFRILIDPTGGLHSLINRKLETVGEADKRFGEDALRLIRALRIVNVCNTALLRKEGKC